jgi:L-fucose mutarotase/ribose pyranase (RbsD/FucU family)
MRCSFQAIATGLLLLAGSAFPAQGQGEDWQTALRSRLPLYGHRNWIVVADSAYPAQSRPGIETVVADADQLSVLKTVLDLIGGSKHVRPIIYLDKELTSLQDSEVPGVSTYKKQVQDLTKGREAQSLLHEEIISKLDAVSQTFRVLIIKTNMTMPYTSVFLQLDCAYWGPEQERKLRAAMNQPTSR